jgi:hypothetical protein
MSAEDEHIIAELTEPVRASLDEAVVLVENLLADLATPQTDITTSEQGKGLCL